MWRIEIPAQRDDLLDRYIQQEIAKKIAKTEVALIEALKEGLPYYEEEDEITGGTIRYELSELSEAKKSEALTRLKVI